MASWLPCGRANSNFVRSDQPRGTCGEARAMNRPDRADYSGEERSFRKRGVTIIDSERRELGETSTARGAPSTSTHCPAGRWGLGRRGSGPWALSRASGGAKNTDDDERRLAKEFPSAKPRFLTDEIDPGAATGTPRFVELLCNKQGPDDLDSWRPEQETPAGS